LFAGLTRSQNDLLESASYDFKQRTYLPSTFAKKQLNSKQPIEHTQIEVIHGDDNEFFEAIVKDIEKQLQDGRAILIVFADKRKMEWYYEKLSQRARCDADNCVFAIYRDK